MLSKTQKNFKKQMAEYKRETESENNNQVYSYIEKDLISNYYNQKSKRSYRKPLISIPVILILLYVAYTGYGIFGRYYTSIAGTSSLAANINSTGNATSISNDKQRKSQIEVNQFLKQINELNLSMSEVIQTYNKAVSDLNNDILTDKGFLVKAKETEKLAEDISYKFYDIVIPSENTNVMAYIDAQQQKAKIQCDIMYNSIMMHQTKDNTYGTENEQLKIKLADLQKKCNDLIISIFNDFNFKYEIKEDGGYTYSF